MESKSQKKFLILAKEKFTYLSRNIPPSKNIQQAHTNSTIDFEQNTNKLLDEEDSNKKKKMHPISKFALTLRKEKLREPFANGLTPRDGNKKKLLLATNKEVTDFNAKEEKEANLNESTDSLAILTTQHSRNVSSPIESLKLVNHKREVNHSSFLPLESNLNIGSPSPAKNKCHRKLFFSPNTNKKTNKSETCLPLIKKNLVNKLKTSFKSLPGVLHKTKETKTNQDRLIAQTNVLKVDGFSIFSIMDGHGPNGHFVSEFTKNYLSHYYSDSTLYYIPRFVESRKVDSLKEYIQSEGIYSRLVNNNYNIIRNSIKNVQSKITSSDFETDFSGTTLCQVIICDNHIICTNIGDSKAIMIKKTSSMSLTKEHKPTVPEERKRIEKCGGEVKKTFGGNLGPHRVWVKRKLFPGLAMSRSLGDNVAKTVGVCCEPDIFEYEITDECLGIVVASDGVWDKLQNDSVAEIFREGYKKSDSNYVIEEVITEARANDNDNDLDDISVFVIFFNSLKK